MLRSRAPSTRPAPGPVSIRRFGRLTGSAHVPRFRLISGLERTLFDKPLFAKFNQEQASSDGGAVLLKAAERVYGLVKAFARCLSDKRAPEKIRHTLADLIGQRIFGIACGHPDCNDAEHLADDPIHKLLLGRDPVAGESLASQPTLSRFENAAGRRRALRHGVRVGGACCRAPPPPAGAGSAHHDRRLPALRRAATLVAPIFLSNPSVRLGWGRPFRSVEEMNTAHRSGARASRFVRA